MAGFTGTVVGAPGERAAARTIITGLREMQTGKATKYFTLDGALSGVPEPAFTFLLGIGISLSQEIEAVREGYGAPDHVEALFGKLESFAGGDEQDRNVIERGQTLAQEEARAADLAAAKLEGKVVRAVDSALGAAEKVAEGAQKIGKLATGTLLLWGGIALGVALVTVAAIYMAKD